MRLLRIIAPLYLLLLSGCSWAPSWGVHKIDINQGNALTQDMVEKLKPGQTRQQVRAILGTPLLADIYHANRWDYIYEYHYQGKLLARRQFRVFFETDKLSRWEGDEQPISAAILNRKAQAVGGVQGDKGAPEAPPEPGFFRRLWDWLKS